MNPSPTRHAGPQPSTMLPATVAARRTCEVTPNTSTTHRAPYRHPRASPSPPRLAVTPAPRRHPRESGGPDSRPQAGASGLGAGAGMTEGRGRLLDSRLRGNDGGGRVGARDDPSCRVSSPPRLTVTPAKAGVQTPARGRPWRALRRAGMTGGSALSWIPACAGMTEGAAALAPLTIHHPPYRHPRESGGPDSRHGHLPVAPRPRPRAAE